MKAEQKKTAYCFLLAAFFLMTVVILCAGTIWAFYWNKAVWNTVIYPPKNIVSNCLTVDGQVILLGELTEEKVVEVWFESPVEDHAVISLEWLDPSQKVYLEAYLMEEELALSEERVCGNMRLVPTELASDLEEAVEVDLRMTLESTRGEMLFGVFRVTLPAKEKVYPVPGGGGSSGIEVLPGRTVTLTFTFEDVFNVDGTFALDDAEAIVSQFAVRVVDAGGTAALVEGERLWAIPSAVPVATDVSIAVDVTMKDDAIPGKECTVLFTGIYGDGNGEPGNEQEVSRSATVTVKRSGGRSKVTRTIQPEEPPIIGELSVRAIERFDLEGSLPVSMTLPENSATLWVALNEGGLPALTRYSVDGGEGWYMLYDGGKIRIDTEQMPVFEEGQCLLLDLHGTNWDSTQPLHLCVAADTEEGRYTGEAVSEAGEVLFQGVTAQEPLMMSASVPLELPVPESWTGCETEVRLTHLELSDEIPVYREIVDDSVCITFEDDHVTVAAGEILPAAGTYCLTIGYKYAGVCFAESEIPFFVNYSV